MKRRTFLAGSAGFLTAPLVAEAQQAGEVHRIGFLVGAAPAFDPSAYDSGALLAGLQAHGYVLGQNLSIDFLTARGQVTPDPFPSRE